MLLPVLSAVSAILGVYYLTTLPFSQGTPQPTPQTQTEYHLGCYDAENVRSHSKELEERLSQIGQKQRQSIKLGMHLSSTNSPSFNQDIAHIAQSFELYLNSFYKFKGQNKQDMQYYNSLFMAKRQFQNCEAQNPLNQTDCLLSWNTYHQDLADHDALKNAIKDLVDVKEKTERQLSAILLNKPTPNNGIQGTFTVKINELKRNIDSGEETLIQLKAQKNNIKVEYSNIETELQQLKELLEECVTNQQLIIYCNKITKDVKKIEEAAPKMSKKELELRLAKKQTIISGLQETIKRFRRLNNQKDADLQSRELIHQENELKLLEFQIVNFQTQEESRCAMCSEERIRQLRKNISDLENKLADLNKNLITVETTISTTDINLSGLRKQLEDLQRERETAITAEFCLDEDCKREQRNSIIEKQNSLNELKKEIIDKQVEVSYLQSKIDNKFNRVKSFLEPVNRVVDCLLKKSYYLELKKHKPAENRIEQKMSRVKDTIVSKLSDFEL